MYIGSKVLRSCKPRRVGVYHELRSDIHMTSNFYIEHKHYIIFHDTDRYIRGDKESKSCRDNDVTKQIPLKKYQ